MTQRESGHHMTLQKYQMSLFDDSDELTLSLEDFRAKLSALPEKDEDLQILEVHSFLRSHALHLFSNLCIYNLRMWKDSSVTTKAIPLRQSSQHWGNWGMTRNGKCITANIMSPKIESASTLLDILENNVDDKYFLSDGQVQRIVKSIPKNQKKQRQDRVPQPHVAIIDDQGRKNKPLIPKDHAATLRANTHGGDPKVILPLIASSYNKKQKGRRIKEDGEPMFTITTNNRHGVMVIDGEEHSIRKLTPRECWRLQGFPDCSFDKAREVNSDSQLYKQAGNTVTVPVVYDIAKRL